MASVVADTHAILWHLSSDPRLSAVARSAMRDAVASGSPVFVASVSVVEVIYLVEKGRLDPEALRVLKVSLKDPKFGLTIVPLDLSVAEALEEIPRQLVPDLPDRVIAATALALNLPLVSKDRRIQAAQIQTLW
ncbi:MAG: type II toxin-antitoxin system VapC family toxin [Bryobacteraceae bacterium]